MKNSVPIPVPKLKKKYYFWAAFALWLANNVVRISCLYIAPAQGCISIQLIQPQVAPLPGSAGGFFLNSVSEIIKIV